MNDNNFILQPLFPNNSSQQAPDSLDTSLT